MLRKRLLVILATCSALAASIPAVAAAAPALALRPYEGPSILQAEDRLHRADPVTLPLASAGPTPVAAPGRAAGGRSLQTYNRSGLTREVMGFATYWEMQAGRLTDVQFDKVSTLAYFGLTVNGDGTWGQDSGMAVWGSQATSDLVSKAHTAGDRVVVVAKAFDDVSINGIVSGSTAGQRAIDNIIGAVQSRGLDGVSIDFEGSTSSSYPNLQRDFTSWIANLGRQLRAKVPGAQLTVCSYSGSASWDQGFMNIATLAPSVDAFFIMAYDMTSPAAAPNAPLAGPYTYTDTLAVDQYLNKVGGDGSKVILGVPYYGYEFNTTSSGFAPSASSAMTAVTYKGALLDLSCGPGAPDNLVAHWDTASQTPWATWFSPSTGDPCQENRNTWRQVYFDNAASLEAKYDLVNARGIRGTGMWALGYDHGSTDLWSAIAARFFGTQANASSYHPLDPARVVDTRTGLGLPMARLAAGSTSSVQFLGRGGVPTSGVSAVVLNLTAVNASSQTFFTLSPGGTARPDTSDLNVGTGTARANLVTAQLSPAGNLDLYNAFGQVDVVIDVEGYYSAGTSPDGRYRPLQPARILDTRISGGRLGPGQSLDLQVAGASSTGGGADGVPATGAEAVLLNLTVANPTAQGFVTAFPSDGSTRPSASTLNFDVGEAVPNRVAVKLGPSGKITIYNALGQTDIVVDINGWFTDSSVTGSAGGLFTPVPRLRLADTRVSGSPLQPGQDLPIRIAGADQVPPTSSQTPPLAAVLNVTSVNSTLTSFIECWPSYSADPKTSDLNWTPAKVVTNQVIVRLGPDGGINVVNGSGTTDVVIVLAGWIS
ncbi:MAG: glycosyl hydrolase family 18 protein [Candidatus Dormibacteria bacterium]